MVNIWFWLLIIQIYFHENGQLFFLLTQNFEIIYQSLYTSYIYIHLEKNLLIW